MLKRLEVVSLRQETKAQKRHLLVSDLSSLRTKFFCASVLTGNCKSGPAELWLNGDAVSVQEVGSAQRPWKLRGKHSAGARKGSRFPACQWSRRTTPFQAEKDTEVDVREGKLCAWLVRGIANPAYRSGIQGAPRERKLERGIAAHGVQAYPIFISPNRLCRVFPLFLQKSAKPV